MYFCKAKTLAIYEESCTTSNTISCHFLAWFCVTEESLVAATVECNSLADPLPTGNLKNVEDLFIYLFIFSGIYIANMASELQVAIQAVATVGSVVHSYVATVYSKLHIVIILILPHSYNMQHCPF